MPRPIGDEMRVMRFREAEGFAAGSESTDGGRPRGGLLIQGLFWVESGACAGGSKPSWSSLGEGLRDENMGRLGGLRQDDICGGGGHGEAVSRRREVLPRR